MDSSWTLSRSDRIESMEPMMGNPNCPEGVSFGSVDC